MTAMVFWKEQLAHQISLLLNTEVGSEEIVYPPDPTMGDFAFACFRVAKAQGISPAEVASKLASAWPKTFAEFSDVRAQGAYLNVLLDPSLTLSRVIEDVERTGESYGTSEPQTGIGETLFEYANPNTHKEIHVGHLRNFVMGAAIVRMLAASGRDVVPLSYVNDVGNNVAKCLWQLVRRRGVGVRTLDDGQAHRLMHETEPENRHGRFLGLIYTEAVLAVEQDESLKQEVSFVQHALETHDEAWEHLWRETRRWCVEELQEIFDELGVHVERQYFESDLIDRSQDTVDDLERRGIAKRSEGALVVDLEQEGLGVALIRKTDGTLLYASKDLALAELKIKEYPDLSASIVLVDNRQSLYFKQLAVMLRRLGYAQTFGMVGFELVTLKEGVMSSRKGNVVTYQSFRDAVLAEARKEVIKRHEDWSEGKVAYASWAIAMAAVKFGMLKQDGDRPITFDLAQQLAFDGATGPYCQYAATRLGAIISKSKQQETKNQIKKHKRQINLKTAKNQNTNNKTQTTKRLAMTIAMLPERVIEAADAYRPSTIAQWCLEMAKTVNDFYRDVPVLSAPLEEREMLLRLVAAARQTLQNGLALLGIATLEEM